MRWTPKKYMLEAVRFMVERPHAGLFLAPGLGKTSIAYAAFKILRRDGFARRALVLSPLRPAYLVWPAEARKWDDFAGLTVGVAHGAKKSKLLDALPDVTVMNYEGLRWLAGEAARRGWGAREPWPWDVLIIDESSRLKHPGTERFRTLKPLLPRFKRRYILTGSPAANTLMDLFGQCYTMDLGKTFGPYVTHFRAEFFMRVDEFTWVLQPGAEERIYERLAPRVLRMSEDLLDLPPITYNTVTVDLPPKARRAYDQMETALRLDFEAGRVTAANSGVASMKCRQLAGGGVYRDSEDGSKGPAQAVHPAKTDAVLELLEELEGQPTIVAYEFQHELERLKAALGKDTPHIGGGVSPRRSVEVADAWNRGEVPVLLGQPQSMAHGLNLQAAGRAVVFHTVPWNYEDYDQLIRRVWRQGQRERVVVHHVVARDTVDEAVMAALARKRRGQNALFDALRDYWRR